MKQAAIIIDNWEVATVTGIENPTPKKFLEVLVENIIKEKLKLNESLVLRIVIRDTD